MSITVKRRAAENAYYERVQAEPLYAAVIADYSRRLRDGFYAHADWYGQYYYPPDAVAASVFAFLHTDEALGNIVFCQIYVGSDPSGDSHVEENNQKLSKLPSGFSAKFFGGLADCDGWLRWDRPIELNAITGEGKEIKKILPPGDAPLEVGYTNFETTYVHLWGERILARWPYGSEWITLIKMDEEVLNKRHEEASA